MYWETPSSVVGAVSGGIAGCIHSRRCAMSLASFAASLGNDLSLCAPDTFACVRVQPRGQPSRGEDADAASAPISLHLVVKQPAAPAAAASPASATSTSGDASTAATAASSSGAGSNGARGATPVPPIVHSPPPPVRVAAWLHSALARPGTEAPRSPVCLLLHPPSWINSMLVQPRGPSAAISFWRAAAEFPAAAASPAAAERLPYPHGVRLPASTAAATPGVSSNASANRDEQLRSSWYRSQHLQYAQRQRRQATQQQSGARGGPAQQFWPPQPPPGMYSPPPWAMSQVRGARLPTAPAARGQHSWSVRSRFQGVWASYSTVCTGFNSLSLLRASSAGFLAQ